MSKKVFCLALAVMMLMCATAFAAPSKTANDVTSEAPVLTNGATPAADFTIGAIEDVNGAAQKALDAIVAVINTTAVPAVNAFGEEVAAAIAALLPEGVEAADLDIGDLFALNIANYDPAYGDVTVAFNLLTAENTKVAVLGTVVDGETTWTALEAEVVDGQVVVTFPADVLSAIPEGAETVLATLIAE